MRTQAVGPYPADSPSLYVITVLGVIDPDWSTRLAGMQITEAEHGNPTASRLTGWLIDQGSLHGVLATLQSLGLTIDAVERIR